MISRMIKNKFLLTCEELNASPTEIKMNEHILAGFAYKCEDKDFLFHRFKGEEIQSALTLMIAEEGHTNNIYDEKKNELPIEMVISRQLYQLLCVSVNACALV